MGGHLDITILKELMTKMNKYYEYDSVFNI